MTAGKILDLARSQIGVKESPAGSNKVKYNTEYGGAPKAWCCVFVWWLFREAQAASLFYDGGKTAYAPALLTYHRKQGQAVTGDYEPGDVIFFDFNGNGTADHVGVCESWDGTYITTIDGNTGEGNEANGGCVMRRTRHKKYICGAYRPAYEEEEIVDQKQFDRMMEDWLNRRGGLPASAWSKMGGGEDRRHYGREQTPEFCDKGRSGDYDRECGGKIIHIKADGGYLIWVVSVFVLHFV